MKNYLEVTAGFVVIGLGVALLPKSPDASSACFVVVNDGAKSNAATVFRLGSLSDPTLTIQRTLPTGGNGETIVMGVQEAAMLQHSTDVCIYLADAFSADVAAFIYPSFAQVGRYSVPRIGNSQFGMGVTARGNYLFASYSTPGNIKLIATWNIETGCALSLATTFTVPGTIDGMAISPDGKTLIANYDNSNPPGIDSFSVASDGTLTEHGPYGGPFDFPTGVDITADSKYAVVGEIDLQTQNVATQIGIYAINPDGLLGKYITYGGDGSLGPSTHTGYVWLSPNEKFLFVSGGEPNLPITTLNFDESLQQVTYTGCIANVEGTPQGFATALPTGSGGLLYLAEFTSTPSPSVGLYEIDSSTGCLTEVSGSPFPTNKKKGLDYSVVAWPLRPF